MPSVYDHPTWQEARPNQQIIGDVTDPHIYSNVLWLVAEIIINGLRAEGQGFLKSPSSRHWFNIANLDYDYVLRVYTANRHKFVKRKGNGKGKY